MRQAHLEGNVKDMPGLCKSCYLVDPRLSELLNAIYQYFFRHVRTHNVYLQNALQNALNKIGPMLKQNDFQGVLAKVKSL